MLRFIVSCNSAQWQSPISATCPMVSIFSSLDFGAAIFLPYQKDIKGEENNNGSLETQRRLQKLHRKIIRVFPGLFSLRPCFGILIPGVPNALYPLLQHLLSRALYLLGQFLSLHTQIISLTTHNQHTVRKLIPLN